MINKWVAATGSIFIAVGIILGAFGAHALEESLSPKHLGTFETGVRYLIYHGLALLMIGLSAKQIGGLKWTVRFITAGVVLFSGSLFLLSTQSMSGLSVEFLGPITPIGGLLMIVGWSILIKNLLLPKK